MRIFLIYKVDLVSFQAIPFSESKFAVAFFISDKTFEVIQLEWVEEQYNEYCEGKDVTLVLNYNCKSEKALIVHVAKGDEGLDDFCDYLASIMTDKKWSIEKMIRRQMIDRFHSGKRRRMLPVSLLSTDSESEKMPAIPRKQKAPIPPRIVEARTIPPTLPPLPAPIPKPECPVVEQMEIPTPANPNTKSTAPLPPPEYLSLQERLSEIPTSSRIETPAIPSCVIKEIRPKEDKITKKDSKSCTVLYMNYYLL